MKNIFLIIIILAITIPSYAQTNFGIRTGLNLTDFITEDLSGHLHTQVESSKRSDYYFGVLLSIKTENIYTLQPEFNYSKERVLLKGKHNGVNIKTIQFKFYTTSLINKFNITKKAHVVFGPNIELNSTYTLLNNTYEVYSNSLWFPNINAILGFGFDFIDNLSVEVRYIHGISAYSIKRDDVTLLTGKKSVIKFGIAYKFNFRKKAKKS